MKPGYPAAQEPEGSHQTRQPPEAGGCKARPSGITFPCGQGRANFSPWAEWMETPSQEGTAHHSPEVRLRRAGVGLLTLTHNDDTKYAGSGFAKSPGGCAGHCGIPMTKNGNPLRPAEIEGDSVKGH